MKIENLKYFLAVARTGNMQKAADEQFLTRQNLSLIISNMEKELNMDLFTRTNKGCVLTATGEEFAKDAQQIVDIYDGFLQRQTSVNMLMFEIYTTQMLSDIVKELIEVIAQDGYYLSVQELHFNELSEMVSGNQSGIYLVPLYDTDKLRYLAERTDKILLAQDNTVVTICHKSHPVITLTEQERDLQQYPIIASGHKMKADVRLNISDIAICQNLMRQNNVLYQSSEFFYKKQFSDSEEWKVVETLKGQKIEFALFVNLSDKQRRQQFNTLILPKMKEIFAIK